MTVSNGHIQARIEIPAFGPETKIGELFGKEGGECDECQVQRVVNGLDEMLGNGGTMTSRVVAG